LSFDVTQIFFTNSNQKAKKSILFARLNLLWSNKYIDLSAVVHITIQATEHSRCFIFSENPEKYNIFRGKYKRYINGQNRGEEKKTRKTTADKLNKRLIL
jgi:hypothetical protein